MNVPTVHPSLHVFFKKQWIQGTAIAWHFSTLLPFTR
jgi:hypothetical protein